MNKSEFMRILAEQLSELSVEERNDIVYDYEEHFRVGAESGRTEEELATGLGDPRMIAKQLKAGYLVQRAQDNVSTGNVFKAVIATIALGFFNLVFVLGPFVGAVGVLIGLFVTAIGITVAGFTAFIASIVGPFFPQYISFGLSPVVAAFVGSGLTALGLLFLIGDWYLLKGCYHLTIRYLKWNISIITGRRAT